MELDLWNKLHMIMFKEDVFIRMLRTLYSIICDFNKLQNMKLLCIKKKYDFNEIVRYNAYYADHVIEENDDFSFINNIATSEE